ncbi:MAG: hypothetical protein ACI83W_000818 [Marinoscillum sp.]
MPIEDSNTSSYSLINDIDTYANTALVNKGTGQNYGLEFTLECFFNRGFYYMSTLSIYNSFYTAGDGIERSTAYNGNYIFNMIGGKEFAYRKSGKDKVFFVNTKISLLGGTPYTPIDLVASQNMETTVFEDSPYSLSGDDVFFANLSFGTRKNKRNTTREFKIDFNNATNNSAVIRTYYNQATEEIEKSTQLPMIPNIVYTIKF